MSSESLGAVPKLLPIGDLADRHIGLTPIVAAHYYQAACVCLDRHHQPPKLFEIRGPVESSAMAAWEVTDDRTKAAWANTDDATRDAAYACVIAAVEITMGLFAVRRADTRTGADYYVASPQDSDDMERVWRLEISGSDRGGARLLERRLQDKIEQARRGDSNLPALAGVVGFAMATILIEKVDLT